jgi:hypothetical protein
MQEGRCEYAYRRSATLVLVRSDVGRGIPVITFCAKPRTPLDSKRKTKVSLKVLKLIGAVMYESWKARD